MEHHPSLISRRNDEPDFNLREWALKANISRDQNTKSRRHSASNIKSFREDTTRSFRTTTSISSTVSSPGYTIKDEINPYTYSFTTALRALQARSGYGCECLSPDGFSLSLNSKWNEAEKYISNPLSGEVPMECLSTKTLSGRSRITVSGPLVYSSRIPFIQTKPSVVKEENQVLVVQGKKIESLTRDVGTQSTPPDISSSSPSPSSTPSVKECTLKRSDTEGEGEGEGNGDGDGDGSSFSGAKSKHEEEIEMTSGKREAEEATIKEEEGKDSEPPKCLPWRNVWVRNKQKKNHQNCGWQVLFGKRNLKINK